MTGSIGGFIVEGALNFELEDDFLDFLLFALVLFDLGRSVDDDDWEEEETEGESWLLLPMISKWSQLELLIHNFKRSIKTAWQLEKYPLKYY